MTIRALFILAGFLVGSCICLTPVSHHARSQRFSLQLAESSKQGTMEKSLDPKDELVTLIVNGLSSTDKKIESDLSTDRLESLLSELRSKTKGFEADMVDGDWALVYTRQGEKSPKLQKAVGKKEKAGFSLNRFDTKDMTFGGDVKLLRNKLVVSTKVKYEPLTDTYDKTSDGKIVLRRISCDIVDASLKFWRFPTIPLPLRKKGGYLDFIYMDEDIRITKGNRGGLFVHFRPQFLEQKLA